MTKFSPTSQGQRSFRNACATTILGALSDASARGAVITFWCFALVCCGGGEPAGSDAGGSDATSSDGAQEVDSPAPDPYSDFNDSSKWSAATILTRSSECVAFDGRYVYFAPGLPGFDSPVTRYDTTKPFDVPTSWDTFDLATINESGQAFSGASFDGRYIYLAPYSNGPSGNGLVARYDTNAPFAASASWTTFDTTSVDVGAKAFRGAVFDGRYVYLVPFGSDAAYGQEDGIVARYDTHAPFETPSSWVTFDATNVDAGAKGWFGGAFDGRYVYFAPYFNGTCDGLVVRYDTTSAFQAVLGWSTFDTTSSNASAYDFGGALFDGRYVYFAPYQHSGPYDFSGIAARYDTLGAFCDKASWATFNTSLLGSYAEGFRGLAFDGRYVYLLPRLEYPGLVNEVIARYDTQATFDQPASWATHDMGWTDSDVITGAAFDGRFMYFVSDHGAVARFDARNPPVLPVEYRGSFF